jgi:DNA-binding MarR family transcriptional regulator
MQTPVLYSRGGKLTTLKFYQAMIVTELPEDTEIHAQATELAQILMKLQRCFLTNLSAELSRGSVSFPQYSLLTYLDNKEVISMSEIAAKMGHTTAAATGLVDRLERLGYVHRAHAVDDRRKVMVRITRKGSNLVARVRQDMVDTITLLLKEHLTVEQGRAWLEVYRKITQFCDATLIKE